MKSEKWIDMVFLTCLRCDYLSTDLFRVRWESASSSSSSSSLSRPSFFRQSSGCHMLQLKRQKTSSDMGVISHCNSFSLLFPLTFSFSCFLCSFSLNLQNIYMHTHTHTHTHTSSPTTPLISAVLAGLDRTPLICSSDWLQWLKGFSHFFSPSNEPSFAHHYTSVQECTHKHTHTLYFTVHLSAIYHAQTSCWVVKQLCVIPVLCIDFICIMRSVLCGL